MAESEADAGKILGGKRGFNQSRQISKNCGGQIENPGKFSYPVVLVMRPRHQVWLFVLFASLIDFAKDYNPLDADDNATGGGDGSQASPYTSVEAITKAVTSCTILLVAENNDSPNMTETPPSAGHQDVILSLGLNSGKQP